jgi:hypothetical protein
MHRGISKRARSYVRRHATGEMLTTCQIERVQQPAWDPATNLVTAGDRTIIYTGVCRLWEVSGSSAMPVADDVIQLQTTNLSIPWDTDPIPAEQDEVLILSSLVDEALVGKRYRILTSAKAGDLRATRRFVVQGVDEV